MHWQGTQAGRVGPLGQVSANKGASARVGRRAVDFAVIRRRTRNRRGWGGVRWGGALLGVGSSARSEALRDASWTGDNILSVVVVGWVL